MKAKQKAAAATDDAVTGVVNSSPRRARSRSPSVPSPGRLLPDSGMMQSV